MRLSASVRFILDTEVDSKLTLLTRIEKQFNGKDLQEGLSDKFTLCRSGLAKFFLNFSSNSTALEIAPCIRESGDVFRFQSAYKHWQGKRARTSSLYFTEPRGNRTECNPFCLLLCFPSSPCVVSASRWLSHLCLELSTCDRITQSSMVTAGLNSSPSLT